MFSRGFGVVIDIVSDTEIEVFVLGDRRKRIVKASNYYIGEIRRKLKNEYYIVIAFDTKTREVIEEIEDL